ncbi:hypothetical protein [Smaragdicoccus niigatensis]|uniref:hypothetical protein n=1 Tax=Smaragdicoccus niigatensis TaxID=359359 RepID=UPI00035CB7D7|nr:hypothetical protein [Smaragdicoccus niigatensis]
MKRATTLAVIALVLTSAACTPSRPSVVPTTPDRVTQAAHEKASGRPGTVSVFAKKHNGDPIEGVRFDIDQLESCNGSKVVVNRVWAFSSFDGGYNFVNTPLGCNRVRATLAGTQQSPRTIELTEAEPNANVVFEYPDDVVGTCNPRTIAGDLGYAGDATVDYCDVVWARVTLGEHGDTTWLIDRVDDRWERYMNLIEHRCLSAAPYHFVPDDLKKYFDATC